MARPVHLHLKAGKACVQGGWDPLVGIAKSHRVCWVGGKDEDTECGTGAFQPIPNLMVYLVKTSVVHTLNPNMGEAEAGKSLELMPACST